MNKWLFGVMVVLVILITAGLLARKSVQVEIVIDASPEEVWAEITDTASYGEWNPIFTAYEGSFAEGNKLKVQMKMGESKPVAVETTVKNLVPEEWLHQGGGYPLIITYDHNWSLEPVGEGTRVRQYEDYTGIYVLFWDPTPAALAYAQANANLKNRLENN